MFLIIFQCKSPKPDNFIHFFEYLKLRLYTQDVFLYVPGIWMNTYVVLR